MDTTFSKWLITQMQKRGWSQADLSRHSGLTRQAIANYVDGRAPNTDSIVILARVFKTSPEILFRIAMDLPGDANADPWVEEMSDKLKQIKPGLRSVAETVIDGLVEGEGTPKSNKRRKSHKATEA